MNIPGFTAAASLGPAQGLYTAAVGARGSHAGQTVTPQLKCPPPGLCAKASRLCQNPVTGGGWCDILDKCVDCLGS